MKFTSICKKVYDSVSGNSYLEYGKIYTVVPYIRNGKILHYDIYDNETPIIVFYKTPVSGLSTISFPHYFYSLEEMREIKINSLYSLWE